MAQDNFKIDGIVVPSPQGLSCNLINITLSYTGIDGIYHGKPKRIRKQVTWEYKALNKQALEEMFNKFILNKILETKEHFFDITTPFMGEDQITMRCYSEGEIKTKAVHGTSESGITYWQMSITWTEIEGIAV